VNASEDKQYLLFGGGLDKPEIAFENTLSSLPKELRESLTFGGNNWGFTDLHNSYLDQIFKNGLVFSLLYAALLMILIIQGYRAAKVSNGKFQYSSFMFVVTIFSYIMFNSFYSNFADYAVYSQFYFLSFVLTLPILLASSNKSSVQ
jgi:hypothetical protein